MTNSYTLNSGEFRSALHDIIAELFKVKAEYNATNEQIENSVDPNGDMYTYLMNYMNTTCAQNLRDCITKYTNVNVTRIDFGDPRYFQMKFDAAIVSSRDITDVSGLEYYKGTPKCDIYTTHTPELHPEDRIDQVRDAIEYLPEAVTKLSEIPECACMTLEIDSGFVLFGDTYIDNPTCVLSIDEVVSLLMYNIAHAIDIHIDTSSYFIDACYIKDILPIIQENCPDRSVDIYNLIKYKFPISGSSTVYENYGLLEDLNPGEGLSSDALCSLSMRYVQHVLFMYEQYLIPSMISGKPIPTEPVPKGAMITYDWHIYQAKEYMKSIGMADILSSALDKISKCKLYMGRNSVVGSMAETDILDFRILESFTHTVHFLTKLYEHEFPIRALLKYNLDVDDMLHRIRDDVEYAMLHTNIPSSTQLYWGFHRAYVERLLRAQENSRTEKYRIAFWKIVEDSTSVSQILSKIPELKNILLFKFNSEVPAEERVMFQSNSILGKGLESAIQKLIDFKTEYVQSHPEIFDKSKNRDEMFVAIDTYARDKFAPEIRKAIKNGCGITVNELHLNSSQYLGGLFATSPFYGEKFPYNKMGTITSGNSERPKDVQELLKQMESCFDAKSSMIKDPKNTNMFQMNLYFDLGMATCLDLYISPEVIAPMTAREITGIVTHEIGHNMMWIEDAARRYHLSRLTFDSLPELLPKFTKTELSKLETLVTKAVTNVDNMGGLPGRFGAIIISLVLLLVKLRMFGFVGYTIYAATLGIFLGGYILLGLFALRFITDVITGPGSSMSDTKQSDILETTQVSRDWERRADEFAAMHGYAAAVQSGLDKLYKITAYAMLHGIKFDDYANTKKTIGKRSVVAQQKFFLELGRFFYQTDSSYGLYLYGPMLDRYKNALRDNFNILKDTTIREDVRKQLVEDSKQLISIIDEYQSSKAIKAQALVFGWLDSLMSNDGKLTNSATRLITGNTEEGYRILQDATDGLIKNPLYYQSSRLTPFK